MAGFPAFDERFGSVERFGRGDGSGAKFEGGCHLYQSCVFNFLMVRTALPVLCWRGGAGGGEVLSGLVRCDLARFVEVKGAGTLLSEEGRDVPWRENVGLS